ncbi:MAG TPA: M15 family metallopeptidase [Frankiaceae bacterium]|nr:M15 family metallopeptidase [Frankiaceae bacterium]
MTRSRGRLRGALIALGLLSAACGSSAPGGTVPGGPRPAAQGVAASVSPVPMPAPTAAPTVKPLKHRVRPDVLVVSAKRLPEGVVTKLRGIAPNGVTTFRSGKTTLNGKPFELSAVDPSRFRAFAPTGTAESNPVWEGVARNELVVSHEFAKKRKIALGSTVTVGTLRLRVAAYATTLPEIDAIVSHAVGDALRLPAENAALLTAGQADPTTLASTARKVAGAAKIHLLTQPQVPFAFLTGSSVAQAFGAFSYRWYEDGTIQPDARWVADNIVGASVPVIGRVTCHRLIVPQLRAAMRELEARGLDGSVRSFDGCYVPRFIERDPGRSVSLHTWGIAFDLNATTNMPGRAGDMDMRVVDVMKRWGFRWGGDWSYPDPMHFELGALMRG